MKLKIEEIIDKDLWELFVDENCVATFMQSYAWGEFEEKVNGHKTVRIAIINHEKIIALAQILIINAKRGKYLYLPHGPIFAKEIITETFYMQFDTDQISSTKSMNEQDLKDIADILTILTTHLKKIAKENKCAFIRLGSTLPNLSTIQNIFTKIGFHQSHTYLNSENACVVEIKRSDEEILANMRKTHRNLIRRKLHQEMLIEKRVDEKALEEFFVLYDETVKREKFRPFSQKYIRGEYEQFAKEKRAIILLGKEKAGNDWIYSAGAVILFTKNSAFYHQGASIHSKLPVMYQLHWQGILEAKKRGCRYYNMWGVSKEGRTPSGWDGLSSFKYGFGGKVWDYLPTQDLKLDYRYHFTKLIEKLQKH